jgi:hypothetical protein
MAELTKFPISAVLQGLEQSEGIDALTVTLVIQHLRMAGLIHEDKVLWADEEFAHKQLLISEV